MCEIDLDELARGQEEEKRRVFAGEAVFGRWQFMRDRMVLTIDHGYEIDLGRLRSEAQLVKWMIHLREKQWITAEDLGHLFRLVHFLCGEPYDLRKGAFDTFKILSSSELTQELPEPVDAPASAGVYAITTASRSAVKVGRAINVRSRISELQTGSPEELLFLKLLSDTPSDESRFHKVLEPARLRGEWFRVCDLVVHAILYPDDFFQGG